MTARIWDVHSLIPAEMRPEEWSALNLFANQLQAEVLPDDPSIPLEQTINTRMNIPPVMQRSTWAAWEKYAPPGSPRLLAEAFCQILNMPENAHIAQVTINIHPSVRRQGLGTRMLALAAGYAQKMNRRLLFFNTYSRIEAAEPFLRRIGAEIGMTAHVNQLKLAELDRSLVSAWIVRSAQLSDRFELGFWEGPYPEEYLEQLVIVKTAMDQAPTGSLDIEPIRWTPGILKQTDESMVRRKINRWTYYIREKSTGNLAGFTEVFWMPSGDTVLQQGDTGVLETYRNLGLGRWLKAAMLQKVLAERPAVQFVRTGNADNNAPMLKINTELGFRHYFSQIAWQAETSQVLDFLSSHGIKTTDE